MSDIVTLTDFKRHTTLTNDQLRLLLRLYFDGVTVRSEDTLTLEQVLVLLLCSILYQFGAKLDAMSGMLPADIVRRIVEYADDLETALDDNNKRLPLLFFTLIDSRYVWCSVGSENTRGVWDTVKNAWVAGPGRPMLTLTICLTAVYMRSIGITKHKDAADAFLAGVSNADVNGCGEAVQQVGYVTPIPGVEPQVCESADGESARKR